MDDPEGTAVSEEGMAVQTTIWLYRAAREHIPTNDLKPDGWRDAPMIGRPVLRSEVLAELRHKVLQAERDTWKHRREWISLMLALLFGAITAGSVLWNVFSTQKRLTDLTDRIRTLEVKQAATRSDAVVDQGTPARSVPAKGSK